MEQSYRAKGIIWRSLMGAEIVLAASLIFQKAGVTKNGAEDYSLDLFGRPGIRQDQISALSS